MTELPSKYRKFFRPGDTLCLGIHSTDKGFAEDSATVILVDDQEMRVELCGKGFPPHLEIFPGTKAVITKGEGRTVFQCRTVLKEVVAERCVKLQFFENPEIKESLEYVCKDVAMHVNYELPASQDMGRILNEWEELKKCSDRCQASSSTFAGNTTNSMSYSRVNLSGSSLRFKINDCLSYGTLLHLNIVIPGEQDEHIHAIGSIVRTKELLPELQHNEYYSTSMSFRMIDSHDRKKLMKYVLDEQRKAIL